MLRRRHSLSTKLVSLFVLSAVAFIILVGGTLGSAFRSHVSEVIRPHVAKYFSLLQQELGNPPDKDKAIALAKELGVAIHIVSKNDYWSTDDIPIDMDKVKVYRQQTSPNVEYAFGHDDQRELMFARLAGYTLIFTIPRDNEHWHWRITPLAVLLLVLMFLYHGTKRLISPLRDINNGIQRIGSGDLDYRLPIKRRDEFGTVATSVNAMAADIQKLLDAKRQLLLAISHELRSPITRAKVIAELSDNTQQRQDLHRELDEMEKLIEELLETERLATAHQALNLGPVELGSLVKQTLIDFFPDSTVRVTIPGEPAQLDGDDTRLRLLVKNLVDNAIRHTPPDGAPPEVTLAADHSQLTLTVSDHGPGIAAEHLPHLTEPFYRVDPARQRQTGGYGLGLYLCRRIAEAHGGNMEIRSAVGQGTVVVVTLASRPRSVP